MTNKELETKILEILEIKNFFEMVLKAKDFEKDYKKSEFYSITRMSLMDVLKYSRIWYTLNLTTLKKDVQELIDGLSLENIQNILDEAGAFVTEQNEEGMNFLTQLKDIINLSK